MRFWAVCLAIWMPASTWAGTATLGDTNINTIADAVADVQSQGTGPHTVILPPGTWPLGGQPVVLPDGLSIRSQNNDASTAIIDMQSGYFTTSELDVSINNVTLANPTGATRDTTAVEVTDGFMSLTGVVINDLSTTAMGGALHVNGPTASANVTSSTFDANSTTRSGGHIAVEDGMLLVQSSTFSNGSVPVSGGDINDDIGDGGAIFARDAIVDIISSTFTNHSAADNGAAVFILYPRQEVNINDCTFEDNVAGEGAGGAIFFKDHPQDADPLLIYTSIFERNTSRFGGGISLGDADVDIDNSRFMDNSAPTGGAITSFSGPSPPRVFDPTLDPGSLRIRGSILSNNVADATGASGDGGAIWGRGINQIMLEGNLFCNNDATNGSGGAVLFTEETFASTPSPSNLVVRSNVFVENSAGVAGGAIELTDYGGHTLFVENNHFLNNTAVMRGSAAAFRGPAVTFVQNLTVEWEEAAVYYDDTVPLAVFLSDYNLWYRIATGDSTNPIALESGIGSFQDQNSLYDEDPLLANYTADGDCTNDLYYPTVLMNPFMVSPAIDAGDPLRPNFDGTPPDIGAFGGIFPSDVDGDGWGAIPGLGADCDDNDSEINPGATETYYDGVDQNCDGLNDYDQDLDGFDGPNAPDCDDMDADINPNATEIPYDLIDQDCDPNNNDDADGDGFNSNLYGGTDCDDSDAAINPSAAEIWYDGEDQNCDGANDYDQDGDGSLGNAEGTGDDCDDTDPGINPGLDELIGNNVDENCDGIISDVDGDGFESTENGGDDCDDEDPNVNPSIGERPGNYIDENCDGILSDADGDGFESEENGGDDCNDNKATIYPGATEIWYDDIDDNCDGNTHDQDGDGFLGEADGSGLDCNDTDANIYPATPGHPSPDEACSKLVSGSCSVAPLSGSGAVLLFGLGLIPWRRRRAVR